MAGSTQTEEDLVSRWKAEELVPFTGWDFSYLQDRMLEDQPPWSYSRRVGALLEGAQRALDMGTGGGERLLALRNQWPSVLVATEDYPPNVFLSGLRLDQEGVGVVVTTLSDRGPMPFENGAFDVVLNRHSALDAAEVARILAPNGTFYTQQVHGLWAADLLAVFGASPQWPDSTLEKYVSRLVTAGLVIVDVDDWSGRLQFTDVGAVVYYLKAVPWLVPGFSVETHFDVLMRLQARLDQGEPLAFLIRKYVIEARREG